MDNFNKTTKFIFNLELRENRKSLISKELPQIFNDLKVKILKNPENAFDPSKNFSVAMSSLESCFAKIDRALPKELS